jgi:hypothetical protein
MESYIDNYARKQKEYRLLELAKRYERQMEIGRRNKIQPDAYKPNSNYFTK